MPAQHGLQATHPPGEGTLMWGWDSRTRIPTHMHTAAAPYRHPYSYPSRLSNACPLSFMKPGGVGEASGWKVIRMPR